MKILIILLCFIPSLFAVTSESNSSTDILDSKHIWNSKNIWIKTYVNNKNYYTTINNIVKIEQKIKRNQKNSTLIENLTRRLTLQKSKLELYERNNNFETLLAPYKYTLPEITAYDYFYKSSQERLERKIDKLIYLKNEFNKANSLLNNSFKKNKKGAITLEDLKYFEEFSENINKTYLNIIESKEELEKKYSEYYQEKLQKHILTLIIVLAAYTLYRLLMFFYRLIENRYNKESNSMYAKVISILFYILMFLYVVVRYMQDFIYIITFLSVVAAALTIALREVILNLVASVYIFFSNMIRIGDRVMVQFETKHTIGDITDISLMKIKLNEIDDYTNVKEVKSVGRTIYIPNSYVFTKVFYNYSRKKNGQVNDLIEFEFSVENDFEKIENLTSEVMHSLGVEYKMTFTLNNLKTGVIGLISYQTNYKEISKRRGLISIELLQAYTRNEEIKLKGSKV